MLSFGYCKWNNENNETIRWFQSYFYNYKIIIKIILIIMECCHLNILSENKLRNPWSGWLGKVIS